MRTVDHIILFKGRLATLDLFMDRFIDFCKKKGIDYYLVDTNIPDTYNGKAFDEYITQPGCVMFTFNNVGIKLTVGDQNIWKNLGIPVYDFIVDPPRAFSDILLHPDCDIRVISLDENRNEFIREFYPEIKKVFFLPAGGMDLNSKKNLVDRKYDVIYMGSCQAKDQHYPFLDMLSDGGRDLYQSVVDAMIENPSFTTEQAIKNYLKSKEIVVTPEQLLHIMIHAANPIEGTVRRYYKLIGIKALDLAGVKVNIWGNDWADDEIVFSDNITVNGFIDPYEVLEKCGDAKISLVFIGWQKRGCSEKNFDSMLNRSVCVTDSTSYLKKNYVDGYNIVYFDMQNPAQMAADIKYLLENLEQAQVIADRGYETARKYDSWEVRCQRIYEIMRND